jgi:hypothetical protein
MEDELSKMRVLVVKFGLDRRGSRKFLVHEPATVTEESWPSFAVRLVKAIVVA